MTTTLRRTIAPTAYPVTIQEAMTHCRQADYSDEVVEEMARLIAAATEHAESVSRRSFLTQTWELTLSDWPSDDVIRLPRPPILASPAPVVQYVDSNGDTQTLDAANYLLNTHGARITLAHNQSWPDVREQDNAVTITYTAGYGATHDAVPQLIRQAVLSIVVHWYDFRGEILTGTIQSGLPLASQTILMQERSNHE